MIEKAAKAIAEYNERIRALNSNPSAHAYEASVNAAREKFNDTLMKIVEEHTKNELVL